MRFFFIILAVLYSIRRGEGSPGAMSSVRTHGISHFNEPSSTIPSYFLFGFRRQHRRAADVVRDLYEWLFYKNNCSIMLKACFIIENQRWDRRTCLSHRIVITTRCWSDLSLEVFRNQSWKKCQIFHHLRVAPVSHIFCQCCPKIYS